MKKRTMIVSFGVATILLVACQGYEVTLNERQIYQPPKVLTDFRVDDNNLQTCLDQTIKDQHITAITQLKQLSCTHAGIKSLAGLEMFRDIEALNLSDNKISNIDTVAKLSKLKILQMTNNLLVSADAALTLLKLEQLNLSGNTNLNCIDLNRLRQQSQANITLPDHCR